MLPRCSPLRRGTGAPAAALASRELWSPPVTHGANEERKPPSFLPSFRVFPQVWHVAQHPLSARRRHRTPLGPPHLPERLLPAQTATARRGDIEPTGREIWCLPGEGNPPRGFHPPPESPLTQRPDAASRSCRDERGITRYASSRRCLWLLSRALRHPAGRADGHACSLGAGGVGCAGARLRAAG